MDLGLTGRRAIVCASSRGLGRGCAMALAEAGVDLVINGRDAARVNETAEEIRKASGVSVTGVVADVSSREGQAELLHACPDPDILINNNGGPPFKDYRELERTALLDGVIQNMIAPIELIQAVIDPMVARRFGRIVNITSMSVKKPISGLDLSSGARAGLTAFLAGVARNVACHNVTINFLLPGMFDTDRLRSGFPRMAKLQNKSEQQVREERAASVPAGRFGNPEEFGKACAFLCSVHAGYITGQNLLIDGGAFEGAF